MVSKTKLIKEQLQMVENELAKYGIYDYVEKQTAGKHVMVNFEVNGQKRSITIAGSPDDMAIIRNRSILRGILAGRR